MTHVSIQVHNQQYLLFLEGKEDYDEDGIGKLEESINYVNYPAGCTWIRKSMKGTLSRQCERL
jgi:hypothetical protein